VAGKITLAAVISSQTKPSEVVFYVDDKEVGRVAQTPFRCEWETASIPDGEHAAKWIALSAEGSELATGSTVLIVSNKGASSQKPSPEGPAPGPSTRLKPPVTPEKKPVVPKPEAEFTCYSSDSYDLSIEHPATWSVKDQTSGLPRGWKGGYWLVVSTDPLADATCVINLKHRMLDREHTADSFVKYTEYVASWGRSIINGHPVFTTTAGSPESKRVVHRVMMLDGRHLWMMNCIDTSGKPIDESRVLFQRIVQSLAPAGTPADAPVETPDDDKVEE
jgi:hypothetical protein